MYSALVMDNATLCCFLENHDMSIFPKNLHISEVLFLSILHPPKLASLYACKANEEPFGYHNPKHNITI